MVAGKICLARDHAVGQVFGVRCASDTGTSWGMQDKNKNPPPRLLPSAKNQSLHSERIDSELGALYLSVSPSSVGCLGAARHARGIQSQPEGRILSAS